MRLVLVTIVLVALAPWRSAAQDRSVIHIVRAGDTLASIAERYYGDPRRESVLVAENGLAASGGASITVGLRLVIPWVTYHRVQPGETWAQLADLHYGSDQRVGPLLDANGAEAGDQPDEGAEVVIPYPLRHVTVQVENMTKLSKLYYGSARETRQLIRFNDLRTNRVPRGQIVLVPLADLVLSDEGRRLVAERTGVTPPAGEVQARQSQIAAQLDPLREHVREGRYAEAVALGNRLLGSGDLTGNQIVSIQRELGVAYLAMDRDDLAIAAFREALAQQPDLELDAVHSSPTVMRAFRAAQVAHRAAMHRRH